MSICDDVAVVGAKGSGNILGNSGAAYIFAKDGGGNWNQAKELLADTPLGYDQFGYSVGVAGDLVIVGAFGKELAASLIPGLRTSFPRIIPMPEIGER